MRARRTLDLASNALQQVDGLGGLVRLERLSLAHNRITSLAGLSDLQVGVSATCTQFVGIQIYMATTST